MMGVLLRFGFLAAVLVLAVGLIWLVREILFRCRTVEATGQVTTTQMALTSLDFDGAVSFQPEDHVSIEFPLPGRQVTHSVARPIRGSRLGLLAEGQPVIVRYDPHDPDRIVVEGFDISLLVLMLWTVVAAGLLVSLIWYVAR